MTCAIESCDRPTIARRLCIKHYQRWKIRNPGLLGVNEKGIPAIDRLLSRCAEVDDCWLYQGALDHRGYVRLRGGPKGRKVFGHRLAWEFFIGPFPEGLTFDHLCRRKNCVNPWHGEPVPSGINSRRAPLSMGTINAAKTHCPQGHPYMAPNLVTSAPGRVCRECRNEANRAYRLRLKEKTA